MAKTDLARQQSYGLFAIAKLLVRFLSPYARSLVLCLLLSASRNGSTLGPLLFLLYVNDISRVLPGENIKLFADDTNLFISGVDVNTLNQKCKYCIDTLNQWFIANRLHVNVDKTNIIIFPTKTKANDICVKLNDLTGTKVQYCRYLGIFLDDALT